MRKKSPIKISICNELFQGWPIEKVFEYASQLGYDGVEIAPYTLADSVTEISTKRRTAIRRAAEENGIEIVGLHWLLMKPEGLYINPPDEIIRIQTQEYMEALIHFCADIGGKVLVHGSPHQRTVQEGWDLQEAWDFAKETFKVCLKTARKRNVLYCIEPLAYTRTNFINTVGEAIQLLKETRHPHFKMLMKNGYKGYLSVEVFDFSPDPQTVASRSIGYLKGILDTLAETS